MNNIDFSVDYDDKPTMMNKAKLMKRKRLLNLSHGRIKRYGFERLLMDMIHQAYVKQYYRQMDIVWGIKVSEKGFLEEGC